MFDELSKIKRILIFSLAYHPFVGGAEVAVKEITDRILDTEFDMITLRFDRKLPIFEKIGNVNVWRVGCGVKTFIPISKLFFPFTSFLKAVGLNYRNKYSIIWSIMANRAGFSALFFKIFYPKVKFVLTLQEGDKLDYPDKRMGILKFFLKPFFRKIFTRADIIQTISHFLSDWAKNMGAKGEVLVVPNGVDLDVFLKEFSQEDIEMTREFLVKNYGVEKTDKFIITTSRLVEKNALEDIIVSLKFLPKNIKLLVAGDGPLKNRLEQKIKEENLGGRVIFLGTLSYKDIPKFLKVSEVFVRPSLSEGMGNSFVEAMAAGVPVVATPVGGIVDFLRDGETGLFCKVRDPQSVADKIKVFLEDEELKNKIIKNAKELVVKKYDWNIVAKDMKYLFIPLK